VIVQYKRDLKPCKLEGL